MAEAQGAAHARTDNTQQHPIGRQGSVIGAIAQKPSLRWLKNTFFGIIFSEVPRKEVSEAVSDMQCDMAHTFYVLPEQLGASFGPNLFPYLALEIKWSACPLSRRVACVMRC